MSKFDFTRVSLLEFSISYSIIMAVEFNYKSVALYTVYRIVYVYACLFHYSQNG